MKRTTIYLPDDLVLEIKIRAKQEGRREADLIREAVATYLANGKRRLPRIMSIASSSKISGEESEDWLMANWEFD